MSYRILTVWLRPGHPNKTGTDADVQLARAKYTVTPGASLEGLDKGTWRMTYPLAEGQDPETLLQDILEGCGILPYPTDP